MTSSWKQTKPVWALSGLALFVAGTWLTPTAIEAQRAPSRVGAAIAAPEPPATSWARAHLDEVNAVVPRSPQELANQRMERIRALYFLSVESRDWAERALDSLAALAPDIPGNSKKERAFEAYRAAMEVVRAKHSRWPPNKLKFLNRGAAALDSLVAENPEDLEIRYLRLASYLFLPFFLRRDDSVAEDLTALGAGLPNHPETFSPTIYTKVLGFVLANADGALNGEQQDRLREVLAEARRTGAPRMPWS